MNEPRATDRRQRRGHLAFRGAAVLAALASACTLTNAFDEVKPLNDGTYGGASSPVGGDGGVDARANDSSTADTHAPINTAAGAVVVGGQMPSDGGALSILAVLDPATGKEIAAREPMVIAAVRYDGLRDLWYLFESKAKDFIPGPTDEVVLHVRSFDLASGRWAEQAAISIPPLLSYDAIAVIRERLLYAAHGTAPGSFRMVTIDTSDPAKPSVLDQQSVTGNVRGLVGTRNTTGPGGVVHIVRNASGHPSCAETAPCLEVIRVRIANIGTPIIDKTIVLNQLAGNNAIPSYASFASLDREVMIFPRTSNDAAAPTSAVLFEPRNQVIEGLPAQFFVSDSLLRRAAVSECDRQVFVVGANGDLDLHVVPLLGDGGGTATKASTGHSGQSVYFEPTSKTVFTPFGQGSGFDLTAFRLSGPPDAPVIVRRTTADWNPPADLRPILLGIREPLPVTCP